MSMSGVAALFALNAGLFAMDAAIIEFADGLLSDQSLTFLNGNIPSLPIGVVTVLMQGPDQLMIDGTDVTPTQPP